MHSDAELLGSRLMTYIKHTSNGEMSPCRCGAWPATKGAAQTVWVCTPHKYVDQLSGSAACVIPVLDPGT